MDINEIESREYKLMLKPACFAGDDARRTGALDDYWSAVEQVLGQEHGLGAKGRLNTELAGKRRRVRFYDTNDHALYRSDCILRARGGPDLGDPWALTLKFRQRDRVLAAAQDFRPDKGRDVKFEEDIKAEGPVADPHFVALYSRSADVAIDGRDLLHDRAQKAVADFLRPYRKKSELDIEALADRPAHLVNGFEAVERVFEGGKLRLASNLNAGFAVILWTMAGGDASRPVVAEASFQLKLKKVDDEAKVARRAWKALCLLRGMPAWSDPTGPTKTAFAFARG